MPYILVMKKPPIHSIIETAAFTRQIKHLGVSATELAAIYDAYASDPEYGKVVKRTGGLRKGRIAKDGVGKSGGYRVFSFFGEAKHPVFLFWIIDKSEDETLTDGQENAFKMAIGKLKEGLQK